MMSKLTVLSCVDAVLRARGAVSANHLNPWVTVLFFERLNGMVYHADRLPGNCVLTDLDPKCRNTRA